MADHWPSSGIAAAVDDVVTSPQAAVSLLPAYVPAGSRVLVIGGTGIDEAARGRGYVPVRSLDDGPAAVMQGFSPDVSWRDLAEATFAVRAGLPWIATNPDLTFPTPGGIAPGNGALVRLVAETVGRGPDAVAGKPEPPLLREAIRRTRAQRPLMVGDRLDTDIAAGSRVGVPTLLVFTGVTTLAELVSAPSPRSARTTSAPTSGSCWRRTPRSDRRADARSRCRDCRAASAAVVDGASSWPRGRSVGRRAGGAALAWRCADAGQPTCDRALGRAGRCRRPWLTEAALTATGRVRLAQRPDPIGRVARRRSDGVLDDLRNYLQMASGLTEATTSKAKEVVTGLLAQGMSLSSKALPAPEMMGQVQELADDLVTTSRNNREMLVGMIRAEVDRRRRSDGLRARGRTGRAAPPRAAPGEAARRRAGDPRDRAAGSAGADVPGADVPGPASRRDRPSPTPRTSAAAESPAAADVDTADAMASAAGTHRPRCRRKRRRRSSSTRGLTWTTDAWTTVRSTMPTRRC